MPSSTSSLRVRPGGEVGVDHEPLAVEAGKEARRIDLAGGGDRHRADESVVVDLQRPLHQAGRLPNAVIHRDVEHLERDAFWQVVAADRQPVAAVENVLRLREREIADVQMRVGVRGDAVLRALQLAFADRATPTRSRSRTGASSTGQSPVSSRTLRG